MQSMKRDCRKLVKADLEPRDGTERGWRNFEVILWLQG